MYAYDIGKEILYVGGRKEPVFYKFGNSYLPVDSVSVDEQGNVVLSGFSANSEEEKEDLEN